MESKGKTLALLCAFFVALNILSLLAEIIIPSICGPFVDRCVTISKSVTNVTSQSTVDPLVIEVYDITLAFDAWNALSDTTTYVLLIYTLWRVEGHLPSFSLVSAQAKVSSREWLLINAMLVICSLAITVASAFRISAVGYSKMKFYGIFGLGILIVYLTAFICCYVFAVVSFALVSLVDACFEEIRNMGEGTLNDVTAAHQKLCRKLSTASQSFKTWLIVPFICCYVFAVVSCALVSLVDACFEEIRNMGERTLNYVTAAHQKLCRKLSTASQSFKTWFIVHWLMFGANCLAVFVFDSMHFSLFSRHFSGAPTVFMAVAFVLNFSIFLVPCVYASRVTWKCNDLLSKVNSMSSGNWNEWHPFRDRTVVNEFIFYAERSKCGFGIGSVAFGSSGTWISLCLGLLGLGARLFTYIK
ncbi:uncharacterized protein LOC110043657 [Orbicella faveolata]|uniref:uncharacterized protein LOC110043657 n=1 Tax=Orbicella faveolata TaxID=48498 RepID=UPI0009E25EC7|nr:uncharacterized protein LOC110043657 [Orbicella faveolata]